MVYKFSFCPHCGKKINIQNNIIGGVYSDYIDLPYKKCPYCNEVYSTGKKLYSDMNPKEQEKINNLMIREAINNAGTYAIITAAIFGFICMILSWINIEIPRSIMIVVLLIICAFSLVKGYINAKKVLEQIKKITIQD